MRPYRPAALLFALLLCAVLSAPVLAQSSNSNNGGIPKLEFEKYTLPNGLQVILHVDHKLPMVNVNSWYHVGSKNERFGRTGFAHLFEHMMFEGSKNANLKYLPFVEKAGANLFEGGVNGTTDEDRTNYFETVPSGSLEFVLWLESDRLATLTDVLTKEKLDNERSIVKNERRQRLENQPYGRAELLISENVFPNGHPYAHSVIGSHEDLNAASVEDVSGFFHTYYTPNNLSLAITGDFDIAEAKRLIAKYYGPIPAGPALDRPKTWVPVLDGQKVIDVKDHVPQERTYFAWPTPAFFAAGDAELELTSLILTDGLTSRLQKALIHDKQLCSDVVSIQQSGEMAGAFVLWVTAKPGASLPEVERVTSEEIARLGKEGPTEEELKRAKAKWELQYVSGLERIGGFGGQADVLNTYNTLLGDPDQFAADVNRHRGPTTEDVKRTVGQWLSGSNRLLVRFHPEPAESVTNVTLDRSKQPPFGADRPFQVPEMKTASLQNGMKVFVAERHDLPKVAVTLATRAGSVADGQGQEGMAHLTTQTMVRGTKTRDALALDTTLGDLGVSLQANTSREYAAFSFDVLRANLSPALAIAADIARNPSFAEGEANREKSKLIDEIAQAENSPTQVLYRVRSMLAFGREHPYGRPASGFRSSVEKLQPEDLIRFHNAYWKPGSSALILAGDISLEEGVALAKQYFGEWAGGAAPEIPIPSPSPMGPGKVFVINKPDAAQTNIAEVLPAPLRTAADYYAFSLVDAVWGGAAGARLMTNLREQHGYSYGVFSIPVLYGKAAYWVAYGGVQSDKTKESVIEFQKELHFIAGQKPVSPAELDGAKGTRIRGFAQEFESLGRVSEQAVQLWSLGVPFSELEREPAQLRSATSESVNAAAEKYANPSHATLLLVGDRAKIEPELRELNVGEIVTLDVEGRTTAGGAQGGLSVK